MGDVTDADLDPFELMTDGNEERPTHALTKLSADVERLARERDAALDALDALAVQVGRAIVLCTLDPGEAPVDAPTHAIGQAVETLRGERDAALAEVERLRDLRALYAVSLRKQDADLARAEAWSGLVEGEVAANVLSIVPISKR